MVRLLESVAEDIAQLLEEMSIEELEELIDALNVRLDDPDYKGEVVEEE
jgi:arginyl-tRNA synthetase